MDASGHEGDSLIHRLAGPSTGKAGLAKDQTEINRIIAAASKGSKFYENERRKDEELTARISRLLRKRDDLLKAADLAKLEAAVDHTLLDLEATRDLSQYIVHVDADAFYASVEVMDNPELKGKAFGVGGGVLTTASYEARKFGVRSAMPMHIAKKLLPELIIVPCRFSRYMEMSKAIMSILERYDPNMHPAGFDEAYLNITQYCNEHEMEPEDCVQQLRDEVEKETKLTVSAGIAANKMLAKICSDRNKPNGQFKLPFERRCIVNFMKDLSVRKVPGIGRVNERVLEALGVKTCGDIYTHRAVVSLLDHDLGLHGLLQAFLGISSNVVEPSAREGRKSVGVERTFGAVKDSKKLMEILENIAESLEEDLEQTGWSGKTLTLKYKLDTYEVFTRAKTLDRYIRTKADLLSVGRELLSKELPLSLRLLGLRLTTLKDLRVDEDKGIKRFFKDATNEASRKKPRLSTDDDEAEGRSLMVDDEEDAAEWEEEEQAIELEETGDRGQLGNAPSPSKDPTRAARLDSASPPSKRKPTSKGAGDHLPASAKPSSTGKVPAPPPAEDAEKLVCPICSSALATDNDGFNAHVDFCLSRSAITELSRLGSQDDPLPPKPKLVPPKGGKIRSTKNPFSLSKKHK